MLKGEDVLQEHTKTENQDKANQDVGNHSGSNLCNRFTMLKASFDFVVVDSLGKSGYIAM